MKKYWHKALFYKEWKTMRWITLLMTLVLFFTKIYFGVISTINELEYYAKNPKPYSSYITENKFWFNNEILGDYRGGGVLIYLIVIILILIFFLFKSEKDNNTYSLLSSMPFTREQIIGTKYITGLISITSCFVINFFIMTIVYFTNTKWIDKINNPFSIVIQWWFLVLLVLVAIFSFIVFIQCIMGNSIGATIVGIIILYVPAFITSMISRILTIKYNMNYESDIVKIFDKVAHWVNIGNINITNSEGFEVGTGDNRRIYSKFFYDNYSLKVIILLLFIVVFAVLAFKAYKHIKLESIGELILYSKLKPVFKWGVAICTGMMFSLIFDANSRASLMTFYVICILGGALGYFISSKVLKIFSR